MKEILIAAKPIIKIALMVSLYLTAAYVSYARKERSGNEDSANIEALILMAKEQPENDSSIALYFRTLEISKQIYYHSGYIRSLIGIGRGHGNIGEYEKSLHYYDQALKYISSTDKHHEFLAGIHNNKATVFVRKNKYDSALQNYYAAIKNAEAHSSELVSHSGIYSNLGHLLNNLYRYHDAIEYLTRAVTIAKEEKDLRSESAIYVNLAQAYRELKDPERSALAKQYLEKALAISSKNKWSDIEHPSLSALGSFYLNLPDKTNADLEKALNYFQKSSEVPYISDVHRIGSRANIGYCLFYLGRHNEAASILSKALEAAVKIDAYYLPEIYMMLAKVLKAQHRYAEASQLYDMYVDMNDSLKGQKMNERIKKIEYNYETEQREKAYLKKELEFSRQKLALQQKNMVAYAITSGILVLSALSVTYYVYRRKKEKRLEQQRLEKAAWIATIEGEERERKRLAKELHDNIGGNLSTIKLWLGNISRKSASTGLLEQDVAEVEQLVLTTLTDVRNTAHHLMPELLLRLGLIEAVKIFCLNVQKASGIDFQFHYFGYIGDLGKEMELIIYRTIQELVQNIGKHSKASTAIVQLSNHESKLSITIEDNGKGFDPSMPNINGMGLQNVRTTIEHLGGQFSISSEPDSGTAIEIELNTDIISFEKTRLYEDKS